MKAMELADGTLTATALWQRLTFQLRLHGHATRTEVFAALHAVQAQSGLWTVCAHDDAPERAGADPSPLHVDMLWFAEGAANGAASGAAPPPDPWHAPRVVVVHEASPLALLRDAAHWRVHQVAAPLRVFVGSCVDEADCAVAARTLQAREPRWRAVDGGESLLILGYRGVWSSRMQAWSAPQGTTAWVELGELVFGASESRKK